MSTAARLPSHSVGESSGLRRRRNSDATRHEILVAAGRRFARAGYAAVRLKDIADDVGVTAPLVIRYFGSKEALFREVATDEGGPTIDRADLDGPRETLGHRLAQLLVAYWLDRATNFPSVALVRSLDFEEAKTLFASEFARRLLAPLTEALPGPDSELRARMIASQAMGVGLFGLGVLIEPDVPTPDAAELDRLVALFGAALQATVDS
jgi:AcrR family transcriptional regulator